MTLLVIILLFVGIVVVIIGFMFSGTPKRDSANPTEKKSIVSDKYSPEMNRFEARKETNAANARNQLLVAVNTEQALIDVNEEREADLDVRAGTRKVEFVKQDTEIVKLQNEQLAAKLNLALTEMAFQHGMDLPTYLQVTAHRNLKQIDLQARATEYMQDQENVSRIQQERLELIDRATQRLFGFYEQRKLFQKSRKPADKDKLAHLNKLIEGAETLILGEQTRYIESTLGQEARRSLPSYDGGTGDSSEVEEDTE
jgi:hypothetical protein